METIYAVSKSRKIGFADYRGNMLTDYEFDAITNGFNPDNSIIVRKGNKKGLINANGLFAPCIYDEIDPFPRDGYLKVKNSGKEGLLNPNGQEIAPCIYDYIILGSSKVQKEEEKDLK